MERAFFQRGQLDDWIILSNPQAEMLCLNPGSLCSCLNEVEETCRREKLYFLGLIPFEAASAFDASLKSKQADNQALPLQALPLHTPPLLQGRYFSGVQECKRKTLIESLSSSPASLLDSSGSLEAIDWIPDTSFLEYATAFQHVQQILQRGDSYQVNFTFRLHACFSGDPLLLFLAHALESACRYGALLDNTDSTFLSFSPELFIERQGSSIRTRPMKGTRKRLPETSMDSQQAQDLFQSEKDRAENIMIVDMMRNDFTRVADIPSVHTSRIFELEQYPSVWQMTSTVEAQSSQSLGDIFAACFPAASVTGAPKASTMQSIFELEKSPRGLYTGSVLFVEPSGDFISTVAIRSMYYDKKTSLLEYGVGSGLTVDSNLQQEYEECLAKAPRNPQSPLLPLTLLETLFWSSDESYRYLDAHLKRLRKSADYFGISMRTKEIKKRLLDAALSWTDESPRRVRLSLNLFGELDIRSSAWEPWPAPLRLKLSTTPLCSDTPWLYHKTNRREIHDAAFALREDADDVLLCNERGEITETTRANIAVFLDGAWYTPPVDSGLLPGIEREIQIRAGRIRERKIFVRDLLQLPPIKVFNALRGEVTALLDGAQLHETNLVPSWKSLIL